MAKCWCTFLITQTHSYSCFHLLFWLAVEFDDLRGLFQHKLFYNSVNHSKTDFSSQLSNQSLALIVRFQGFGLPMLLPEIVFTKFGLMQTVPWRIAEGSLSIAGEANITSWGLTHTRPFPLSHIFVMILITWFEPEFPLNLHLGSLLMSNPFHLFALQSLGYVIYL